MVNGHDWQRVKLNKIVKIVGGGTPSINNPSYWNGDIPWFTPSDITNYRSKYIFNSNRYITHAGLKHSSALLLPKGTILLCTRATIGEMSILAIEGATNQGFQNLVSQNKVETDFLYYALMQNKNNIIAKAKGSTFLEISKNELGKIQISIPNDRNEQIAIANALSDADNLIVSLQKLIAKKKAIKQGAMQDLLTGKRRLPGFSGEWKTKKIKEIAHVCSEKNAAHEKLNVLTCSKHFGFVDSLSYFKNQVFSKDTSGYKVIYKNQIGYPANHIEEGAIGLQNLYEKALVSPIYIVFSVTDSVDSFFLHRLLKLDCYKNIFATETCSSVDRRGSLRWPAFSEVEVSLPDIVEQREVAKVLSDMDTEIEKLEKKLSEYQKIKQGMMQELLTGRIRLINAEPKQEQQVTKSVERQLAVR